MRNCTPQCLESVYVPDIEEREDTEHVVTPLVGGRDQRCDETSDHEYDRHEQGREDVRERQTSGEKKFQQEKREADEPVDVPDVLQHT